MKQILLTQGKVTLVDDDIYELYGHLNWCVKKIGNLYYAVRASSILEDGEGQHKINLHHLVIGKPPKGFDVDHIDGNGLNNQRNNLEIKTHRGNMQNLKEHRQGHLSGTTFVKARMHLSTPWQAQVTINRKYRHLGYYKTQQEAHDAYLKALENYNVNQ